MALPLLASLDRLLIEPRHSYDLATNRKSRLLATFVLAMLSIFAMVDVVYLVTVPGYVVPWYGYIFLFATYLLNRSGFYVVAANLVMCMFPLVVFGSLVWDGGGRANDLEYLLPGLILASILLPVTSVIVMALIDVLGIVLLPVLIPQRAVTVEMVVTPTAVVLIGTVLIVIAMRHRDQVERDRQELLRQSEESYRMLFETAPGGVLIVNPQNRILMANSQMYEMTGYLPEEVLGRSPNEFVDEQDRLRRPLSPIEAMQVSGLQRRERIIVRKDGQRLHVVINSTLMPDGNLQYILQDVTEQKKMENALKASEEKFARSFQSSPDALTISSIDSGRLVEVNDVFCRMSGYPREEALGRSAEQLGIWADLHERQRIVQLLGETGAVRDFETLLRHRSGKILTCLLSVEMIEIGGEPCMLVITRDISERKRMEADLRLSEERYRIVSSVISDYTFFTRCDADGSLHMVWMAGAFEKITGYSPEEFDLIGGWAATVHPDDVEIDQQDMRQLHANQRVISEIRTIRKNGTVCWVRVYAHPVWDSDANQLVGIYGAVQDINEQKRIEQEREGLIHELEAKNAELVQFTYMVSHDLKAPIITIKGFLGFLSQDAATGNIDRIEKDVQRIGEAADKMHHLLNDLLELSRIGRLMREPEDVNLQELVSEVEQTLEVSLGRRNLRVTVQGLLPVVHGDRQRLMEVLQNLLENAIKFLGDQPEPLVEIGQRTRTEVGLVTIYVRDNGIGIAPQFHERIFGLFNRLDPNVEGTGVGLALVKRIIEFHGGRIWVESEAGAGSTFVFTLPEADGKQDESPTAA